MNSATEQGRPLHEAPACWNELPAGVIAEDILLEKQAQLIAFRQNRDPFSVAERRQKIATYFAKKYGEEQ